MASANPSNIWPEPTNCATPNFLQPAAKPSNVWPDTIFELLKKEEASSLITTRKGLEMLRINPTKAAKTEIARYPYIETPVKPQQVLIDKNIADSKWHKNKYALANTQYSYQTSIGLPACIENNMFSINYDETTPAIIPTNRLGKDSYVLINTDIEPKSFEELLFDCKGQPGESLTLEEYVKRQDKIIQQYELSKNLILSEIAVVLNTLNRADPTLIDSKIKTLSDNTCEDISTIIADIASNLAADDKFDSDDALIQFKKMCHFPINKKTHFKLPDFESFAEILDATQDELKEVGL